jgi:hypothetical protein
MKYEKNIIKAAPTINTIGLIFFLFFLISKADHKNSGRSMVVIKLKLLRFSSNYSRIMVQSSGHLATERPLLIKTLYFPITFLEKPQ